MTRNKFSFLSADAKTSIHGELWMEVLASAERKLNLFLVMANHAFL